VTNPALASTAISVVPPRQAGTASGTNNTFRQVGIATGIAAYGALFEHHLRMSLHVGGSQLNAVASGQAFRGAQRGIPQPVFTHIEHVFIDGMHELFVAGVCIAGVGAVLALALVRRRDFAAAAAQARA
jgi:hypothetical protein